MALADALRNMAPPELVEVATTRELAQFLTLYGDTLFLLVRLKEADADLAAGLGDGALPLEPGAGVKPVIRSMGFRTRLQPASSDTNPTDAKTRSIDYEPDILQLLERDRHFGIALRKRANAEALYPDRISVGRAPNKDIVLRHPSVSKFHGWFEVDEEGGFYYADAGSKNATRVNGEPLPAREPKRLKPGDAVLFGAVEALVCAPRALWQTLSRLAKRTA